MESKFKHLEIIQNTISRMASNSFALKGWAVTLIAAVFALASKDADKTYLIVAYIPIFAFSGLDTYYLLQERLYRALYDEVRNCANDKIDFSMDISPGRLKNKNNTFVKCFFSKTILAFYLPLLAVTTALISIFLC